MKNGFGLFGENVCLVIKLNKAHSPDMMVVHIHHCKDANNEPNRFHFVLKLQDLCPAVGGGHELVSSKHYVLNILERVSNVASHQNVQILELELLPIPPASLFSSKRSDMEKIVSSNSNVATT